MDTQPSTDKKGKTSFCSGGFKWEILMSFELIWEDKPTFAFLIGCNSNESEILSTIGLCRGILLLLHCAGFEAQ
jgi:hypothetical protein